MTTPDYSAVTFKQGQITAPTSASQRLIMQIQDASKTVTGHQVYVPVAYNDASGNFSHYRWETSVTLVLNVGDMAFGKSWGVEMV